MPTLPAFYYYYYYYYYSLSISINTYTNMKKKLRYFTIAVHCITVQ